MENHRDILLGFCCYQVISENSGKVYHPEMHVNPKRDICLHHSNNQNKFKIPSKFSTLIRISTNSSSRYLKQVKKKTIFITAN